MRAVFSLVIPSVRHVVDGVPLRAWVPPLADAVLLLGHGGGHSKDANRFVGLAERYARETGLAVVCIDAIDHGERRRVGADDRVPRGWHSHSMPQMVADWQSAVAHVCSIGPAVAYVGFSMGAIFGVATVAAMPSIHAAVFVAGGLPGGEWTDDPLLASDLLRAAGRLGHADVLMLNMVDDALFPRDGVERFFDGLCARSKRLRYFDGGHDDWSEHLIAESIAFLNLR